MTARKKESALGRGLDALIRKDLTDEKKSDDETENNKVPKISTRGSRRKSNSSSSSTKSNGNEGKNKKSEDLKSEEVFKTWLIKLWLKMLSWKLERIHAYPFGLQSLLLF